MEESRKDELFELLNELGLGNAIKQQVEQQLSAAIKALPKRSVGRPPEDQAQRIAKFMEDFVSYYVGTDNAPYAEVRHEKYGRMVPLAYISSTEAKLADLVGKIWVAEGNKVANTTVLKEACEMFLSNARINPGELKTATRVAHGGEYSVLDGKYSGLVVYLDSGEDERIIKVSGTERIVSSDNGGFYFIRKGMRNRESQLLPEPDFEATVDTLPPILNLTKNEVQVICLWVMQSLLPMPAFVNLGIHARTDSGKTTLVSIIQSIADPRGKFGTGIPLPRNDRDFLAHASKVRTLSYDNIRMIPEWFSDLACMVSSGTEVPVRTYYTTNEVTDILTQNPFIFAGIRLPIVETDLMRRSLVLELFSRPKNSNAASTLMEREFRQLHPKLLGAVLNLVHGAIQHIDDVPEIGYGSMPDFRRWSVAAGRSQGWTDSETIALIDTYAGSNFRTSEGKYGVMLDILGAYMLTKARNNYRFEGTPSALLNDLKSLFAKAMSPRIPTDAEYSDVFPANGGEMSVVLKSLRSELAERDMIAHTPGAKWYVHTREGNLVCIDLSVPPRETGSVPKIVPEAAEY